MIRIQIVGATAHPSAVVAAPHGANDHGTDDIVQRIVGLSNLSGVIAWDVVNPATDLRLNVNRPTEGAGLRPEEEPHTAEARMVYLAYLEKIQAAAGGKLGSYVEIHGNDYKELADLIDVATWGVSAEEATAIKEALEATELPVSEIRVEGISPVEKRAWANKLFGVITGSTRALHFELPRKLRKDGVIRQRTAEALAAVISAWAL